MALNMEMVCGVLSCALHAPHTASSLAIADCEEALSLFDSAAEEDLFLPPESHLSPFLSSSRLRSQMVAYQCAMRACGRMGEPFRACAYWQV